MNNPLIEELAGWSERKLVDLRRGVEMMESGIMRTHEQDLSTGRSRDTTAATTTTYRQQIAELEALLDKIRADRSQ